MGMPLISHSCSTPPFVFANNNDGNAGQFFFEVTAEDRLGALF